MSTWQGRRVYSNLRNILRHYYNAQHATSSFKRVNSQSVKTKRICQLASLLNLMALYNPFENGRAEKYWIPQTYGQLLEEADRLYSEAKYLDVYEILNRIQFYQNVEVQWRICRALYKMSSDEELSSSIRANMILEAYGLIVQTLELEDGHPEVHKWMAILLDAKSSLDGIYSRLRNASKVRYHMMKSLDLNGHTDPAMFYMLGNWCYERTHLNWLQKYIVRSFFSEAPAEARLDEAYQYFVRAEQLQPRFFVGNIYMLGRCCYDMGYYYRARYYFTMAAVLPVHSEAERRYRDKAKLYAEKLKDYDVHICSLEK